MLVRTVPPLPHPENNLAVHVLTTSDSQYSFLDLNVKVLIPEKVTTGN